MERRVVDARPAGAGLGCCRRGCGAVRRRNPVSRGGQGGGGRTRQDAVRASSQRQPKDPRDFGGDIEKMRDHLHNEASGGSGFISGMLNGISQAAFGRGKRGNGVFGALGSFYRQVISGLSIETPKGSSNSVLIFPPPPEDPLWIHATEVENFW